MLLLSSTSGRCFYRSDSSSFALIIFWIAVQSMVRFAGATCSAVQSASCLQAAASGHLDQLPGAGNCIVKQYVQYTHLCTVTNYQPSIDHCCCAVDSARILCCRYHQDWYHFRCMDAEDALDISVSDSTYSSAALDMPLMTLLPVILCPLVVIAVCVVCATKCWCYRYDNDTSSSSSSSSSAFCCCRCCRCCKTAEDKKEKIPRERFGDEDDARAPLQQPPSASPPLAPEVQTMMTSGGHPPSCLRVLHPCCASPRRFPTALSSPLQYHHHHHHHHAGTRTACGPSSSFRLLVEPSAPPLPPGSAPADDSYAPFSLFPRRGHFESDGGELCCRRAVDDFQRTNTASSRDRSIADDGFFLDDDEFCCACAADDTQCDCEARLAHAHTAVAAAPCPDCLPPPAYESIHRESRA